MPFGTVQESGGIREDSTGRRFTLPAGVALRPGDFVKFDYDPASAWSSRIINVELIRSGTPVLSPVPIAAAPPPRPLPAAARAAAAPPPRAAAAGAGAPTPQAAPEADRTARLLNAFSAAALMPPTAMMHAPLPAPAARAPAAAPTFADIARASAALPAPPPPRAPTAAELLANFRAEIIGQRAQLEADARQYLLDAPPGDTGEKTVCYMWRRAGRKVHAISGFLDRASRTAIGAAPDKVTNCAEEVLLASHPRTGDFVFSVAFDAKYGWKHACAACGALLRSKHIEDLASAFGGR
jgi:hypothetical protein